MSAENSERRKHRRVFFSKNDRMNAELNKLGGEEALFRARVKDLSQAGMGLILDRTESVLVYPGDRLVITRIHGSDLIDFLTPVTLEVRWVVDTDILEHIGFGCSFVALNGAIQAKLEKYVLAWT